MQAVALSYTYITQDGTGNQNLDPSLYLEGGVGTHIHSW